jgi:tetratricopeptide (TPR) repeat protein
VRTFLRHLCVCLVALGVMGTAPFAQSPPTVISLLDAYAAGRFDQVNSALTNVQDFDPILEQLKRDGPAWITAAGPDQADRRELVAAAFALEAARAGIGKPWKLLLKAPSGLGVSLPGYTLYWQAPPLLLEWACERLRARVSVHPAERWWHLAAIAVGHRSEDFQFMVGSPFESIVLNKQDEIDHIGHVEARLPGEIRLQLAKAIAVEWRWPRDAIPAFLALVDHPDVGAEARVRLGIAMTRTGRHADAVTTLRRAEQETREPHLVYLARLFRGQALEQLKRPKDAEAAYRAATFTIPGAQSAATALAGLLAADGRRLEAQQTISRTTAVSPMPIDPWRVYVHGDDRFWPFLIARLRQEIAR